MKKIDIQTLYWLHKESCALLCLKVTVDITKACLESEGHTERGREHHSDTQKLKQALPSKKT